MSKTTERLDPRQDAFCVHYTTIGEPTFAHAGKSAIASGYGPASARNTATDLLKKPEVQRRIRELHEANMQRNNITVDKILADLEHTRLLALEKGDLSTATRCSELQGKHLAMFFAKQEVIGDGLRLVFEYPENLTEISQKKAVSASQLTAEGQLIHNEK